MIKVKMNLTINLNQDLLASLVLSMQRLFMLHLLHQYCCSFKRCVSIEIRNDLSESYLKYRLRLVSCFSSFNAALIYVAPYAPILFELLKMCE